MTTGKPGRAQWGMAALLVGFGLVFLVHGWSRQTSMHGPHTWPIIDGTVLDARVHQRADGFVPWVRYRYALYGTRFFGHKVDRGGTALPTRAEAEAVIARYPIGSSVDVYYNPDHMNESTLTFSGAWGATWQLFAGVMALVCGIAGVVVTIDQSLAVEPG